MSNEYWYENQMQSHFNEGNDRERRRAVPFLTFIVCLLLTALIGGGVGAALVYGIGGARNEEPRQNSLAAQATTPSANIVTATPAPMNTGDQQIILPIAAGEEGYTKTQIVDIAGPSIVGIDVEVEGGMNWYGQSTLQTGSGSGVIITQDGYIVTNNHVVEGATKIKVFLNDDTEYEAKLIGTDRKTDLAVIKIEATGLRAATLGNSDALLVGNDVVAIGNPLGELRGTATSGMVSALSRTITIEGQEMTLLQTDAAINPGNSGGGLFNDRGELIGIINAKVASSTTEGLGFAIPVNDVKKVATDLMDIGYVTGRAYLGVYTQNVAVSGSGNVDGRQPNGYGGGYGLDEFFGFDGNAGRQYQETRLMVTQVVLGSAAEKAGIQAGDLIVQLEDRKITNNLELSEAIGEYKAGDQVIIKVLRNDAEMDMTVVFGELVPDNG